MDKNKKIKGSKLREEASLFGKFYSRPLYYMQKFDKSLYVFFIIYIIGYFILDYILKIYDIGGLQEILSATGYLTIGYFFLTSKIDKINQKD